MSFDAWGQRRDADSWDLVTDVIAQRFTERTSRGYTSHEQLDEVGLIHMNGRIYDPRLARFLQADPFIQAPGNTQSYNRYSYVWNNPLNATDPSGFFLKKLKKIWDNAFRPFVGAIVGAVVTAYCTPCSGVWGAMFAGGAAGAAGAAANNGNVLQGMLTGAVGGAMFYGIGASFSEPGALNAFGRAVTSGSVGGLMAMSQGGRFAHGFAAAGIGSFGGGGSTPAGFIRSAVLGGIASEVTGGKFKNGAATAAFTWALSQGAQKVAEANAPSGQEVGEVYGHGVWGAGKHGSVRFYPDDPRAINAYLKENGFSAVLQVDESGGQYIVFSGGPDFEGPGMLGNLRGDINRSSDLATAPNELVGSVYAPAGVSKDQYIKQLISNTRAYNSNPVNYDLLPGISQGYNSNSYFRGLVNSAGGTIHGDVNWQYQGFNKPVPEDNF